ncbi:MaoC family dehydratase [Streptomyces sp. NBC_00286]|uniref:MaoC family dehydratase n=1 Tax=Streptomyces sp. NBC_00286 TaxID=2975701 RepID=UPI002E2E0139|nr:MaoC/PaaZ C-terminal domain-containing protein [Streptomyces sp. NBC_00286]
MADRPMRPLRDQTLAASPALAPLLARGALLSLCKRPRAAGGTDLPPTRLVLPGVRIDLAKLAGYERVCGYGVGADALPVTYPHVLGFPLAMRLMSERAFPLPLLGLVHTSVEIVQREGLPATGEYELQAFVEGLAPHRRGTEATLVTEARAGGRLVWESRSTYLARHRTSQSTHSTPHSAQSTRSSRPSQPPQPLPAIAEWRLGGDLGRRYGAASGDRNPIHLHPVTARLFGFRRPIAHGMWTVARCLAEHGVPEGAYVKAEFRAPVLLPGVVTYAAKGGAFELRGGGERVHVRGEVRTLV